MAEKKPTKAPAKSGAKPSAKTAQSKPAKATSAPAKKAVKTTAKKTGAKETAPRLETARITALTRPKEIETITIKSHRELALRSRDVAERVADDPEFSVMFLANPVLALEAYGIKLSRELQHHVMNTLRHPPALRKRRQALEAKLEKALGEVPKPTDPKWLANLVFSIRELEPRQVGKREPAYKEPLNEAAIKRLQAARPKGGQRYAGERQLPVRFSLQLEKPKSAIRRMDLDADLPDLKKASRKPASLSVEQAWFYKDDPVVRDAVELGQIMHRGFPFRTPAEFRKIEAGETVDGFRKFVRSVRVKQVKAK